MNWIVFISTAFPPQVFAFDWGRVGKSALIGGIIGGLIGLIFAIKNKGGSDDSGKGE